MKAGWDLQPLSKIAECCLGKMLDKSKNRGTPRPYLRNVNVRWFDFDLSDLLEMRFEDSEKDRYSACKGDLLICEGGHPGRAAIWDQEEPIYFQKAVHRVRFHEPERARWVLHYLRASHANGSLKSHFTGSGIQHFTGQALSRFAIPLPPLSEQQRIVAILDQADFLCKLRSQSAARLGELRQALFYDMFGDPVTNPRKWEVGTIRDLIAEAKYGTAQKANTDGIGLPILRMGNITYDGCIDLNDLKHIDLPVNDIPKYTTRREDLLFNRTNSKELVGKTAVVTSDAPMAIAGYLVRVRANGRGNTHYISAYLNSAPGKAVLRNMCKNIVGMANINAQELQDIAIPLPPVTLQNDFARQLLGIEHQRAEYEKAVRSAEALFASLQHRAFDGEL